MSICKAATSGWGSGIDHKAATGDRDLAVYKYQFILFPCSGVGTIY